jgi:hypothetical protein
MHCRYMKGLRQMKGYYNLFCGRTIFSLHAQTSGMDVLMRLAACYRNTNKLAEACSAYEARKHHNNPGLVMLPIVHAVLGAVEPNDVDTIKEVKMKLVEIYEITGELHKALDIVYQGISFWRKSINHS